MSKNPRYLNRLKQFWNALGPGLITGASDDDPSAITTFSLAGAQFGLVTLWTALLAFPILAVLQEMCARIGIVSGKGLTSVIKTYYPRWVLYLLIGLSCPAFLFNIGADTAVLGEAGNLLFPKIPALNCSIGFTVLLFLLMLVLSYKRLAAVMKFVCLSLLLYVLVPFLTKQNWRSIIGHSLVPTIVLTKDYVLILTGLTGAIISPYLFFWQASAEVEEMQAHGLEAKRSRKLAFLRMRVDILAGAFFAVLIMYFIMLTTGTILHDHDVRNIETLKDAALALRPLAGELTYVLFSIGIIGTGFLIIPVLSASVSYILTNAFNLNSGFSKTPGEVRLFYSIIAVAMSLGVAMHWLGINPVKALLYTTVLYGITAPFLIAIILHVGNNKKIMGQYCNSRTSNVVGLGTLLMMLGTLSILLYYLLKSA